MHRMVILTAFAFALAALLFDAESSNAEGRGGGRRAADQRILSQLMQSVRSLDGSGNNVANPSWGQVGAPYARNASPNYADDVAAMASGPEARYVSNRIFNDLGQNLFSENGVTQWAFTWGQFLDHTFGLRQQAGGEDAPIAYEADDPLEDFTNELGAIAFSRTPAAAGTGATAPREQVNTVSSYIDAWAVYGGTDERLEWLRAGPVDGDLSNNSAYLITTDDGYLPLTGARGDVTTAPGMDLMGRLTGSPQNAVVAGDVRANENIALTAVHTLFVREHNRIVGALPAGLPEQVKFEIARRVVIAEQQYITYTQFLPALGVDLDPYTGYDPAVNAGLSNEFATVGYRAHSMIHGEIEMEADAADHSPEQLDRLEAMGIEVAATGDDLEFAVPLNVAFGNPSLVPDLGLGALLTGLAGERQYKNDEQIDNQLRSVLFQVPGPGVEDPSECLDGTELPECFTGVLDLGAIDILRGRDHGMPSYNDMRVAYGLPPVESFTAITGEDTEEFPADPEIDAADPLADPDILDFVELLDADGNVVEPGTDEAEENVVTGIRRTTVAARLKAIYGGVDNLDAFVGMVSEQHVDGSEFGPLQLAIWKAQFEALRDGDRLFYANDAGLKSIRRLFGITYKHSLAEIIEMNTDVEPGALQSDVFKISFSETDETADAGDEASPEGPCGPSPHHHREGACHYRRQPDRARRTRTGEMSF